MNKHYRKIAKALQSKPKTIQGVALLSGLRGNNVTFQLFNHPELLRMFTENGGRV